MNFSEINNYFASFLGITGLFDIDIKAAINITTKNNSSVNPQSLFVGIIKKALIKNPIIAATINDPCNGAIL